MAILMGNNLGRIIRIQNVTTTPNTMRRGLAISSQNLAQKRNTALRTTRSTEMWRQLSHEVWRARPVDVPLVLWKYMLKIKDVEVDPTTSDQTPSH